MYVSKLLSCPGKPLGDLCRRSSLTGSNCLKSTVLLLTMIVVSDVISCTLCKMLKLITGRSEGKPIVKVV